MSITIKGVYDVHVFTYLLELVESVDLINEEDGVSLEQYFLISGHLHNLLDIFHTSCCGRELHKLCTQLLVGHFCYDTSKCCLL